jgi:MFS superfamily sulfate permease-like transporter
MIQKMVKELHGKGMDVYMADVHVPVLEYSRKMGLLDLIGEDHVLPTVDAAVHKIEAIKKGE